MSDRYIILDRKTVTVAEVVAAAERAGLLEELMEVADKADRAEWERTADQPECSICRRRHGPEIRHACE